MALDYQEQFYSDKVKFIVGVDEAGRGPLAGPVVAAACLFPRAYINKEINDSKQLSEKKREELFDIICENALAYGVGIVSAEEIDKLIQKRGYYRAYHMNKKHCISFLLDVTAIQYLALSVNPVFNPSAPS